MSRIILLLLYTYSRTRENREHIYKSFTIIIILTRIVLKILKSYVVFINNFELKDLSITTNYCLRTHPLLTIIRTQKNIFCSEICLRKKPLRTRTIARRSR